MSIIDPLLGPLELRPPAIARLLDAWQQGCNEATFVNAIKTSPKISTSYPRYDELALATYQAEARISSCPQLIAVESTGCLTLLQHPKQIVLGRPRLHNLWLRSQLSTYIACIEQFFAARFRGQRDSQESLGCY